MGDKSRRDSQITKFNNKWKRSGERDQNRKNASEPSAGTGDLDGRDLGQPGETVDLSGQCRAMTMEGHQCTRPGSVLSKGGWLCAQHASAQSTSMRGGESRSRPKAVKRPPGTTRRPRSPTPKAGLRPYSMERAAARQVAKSKIRRRLAAAKGAISAATRDEVLDDRSRAELEEVLAVLDRVHERLR